ncbi:MAG: cytochrome c oxidase accessory protein CcoG [Planctomycetota bacterium]
MSDPSASLLEPEKHVLSTLESDGSRRWLTPRLAKGRFWNMRRAVAYALLLVYSGLPWLKIGGKPAVLFDLPKREFTLFGATFLPTDTVLLALTILIGFLSIFFFTALLGRVWCGWACPQTVYMEFVFRPIERLFMGRAGVGGKPRKDVPGWRKSAMYLVFFVVALHLAQTFVSYFVGVENVKAWMWGSPTDHPAAFAIVVVLTILMMIDFAYWREQLCIIGCPYGRLQSVLLDRNSLIVNYDRHRGEPRAPLRKSSRSAGADPFADRGSCISCNMCVHVCPTGIDIRDGLQMECIHCTQCADACDAIMDRTGQPRGLIRYGSQASMEGEGSRFLRPRVGIYAVLIAGLCALLVTLLATKPHADVTLLRSLGRPFFATETGEIENTLRLKLRNRTPETRSYSIDIVSPEGLRLREIGDGVTIDAGETVTEPVHFLAAPTDFVAGRLNARIRVSDDAGWSTEEDWTLLGPTNTRRKAPAAPDQDAGNAREDR